MSKEAHLGEAEVVRVAIALKGLQEHKDKDLNELVDTACDLILFAHERIPDARQNYADRRRQEAEDARKIIPCEFLDCLHEKQYQIRQTFHGGYSKVSAS
jgi:hypothetical protein